MRKTKIICTVGPASGKSEILREMMASGADVFRLNMSHAQNSWMREIVPRIRKLALKVNRPVAILFDTQGPAIRTGDVHSDFTLHPGDIVEFTVHGAAKKETYSVDVNYDGLIKDVSVSDTILVDNGVVQLHVLEKQKDRVRCKVMTEGVLGSRRQINLPGVKVNLPVSDRERSAGRSARRRVGGRLGLAQFRAAETGCGKTSGRHERAWQFRADCGENRGAVGRAADR